MTDRIWTILAVMASVLMLLAIWSQHVRYGDRGRCHVFERWGGNPRLSRLGTCPVTARAVAIAIAALLAESRHCACDTDHDQAWAQELLRQLRMAGLAVVQVPDVPALGPGTPAGLRVVEGTGT